MSPGSETDGETADPSVSQTQDGSKRIVCLRQQASKWIKLKGPVIICSFRVCQPSQKLVFATCGKGVSHFPSSEYVSMLNK